MMSAQPATACHLLPATCDPPPATPRLAPVSRRLSGAHLARLHGPGPHRRHPEAWRISAGRGIWRGSPLHSHIVHFLGWRRRQVSYSNLPDTQLVEKSRLGMANTDDFARVCILALAVTGLICIVAASRKVQYCALRWWLVAQVRAPILGANLGSRILSPLAFACLSRSRNGWWPRFAPDSGR